LFCLQRGKDFKIAIFLIMIVGGGKCKLCLWPTDIDGLSRLTPIVMNTMVFFILFFGSLLLILVCLN
jgi:hypothetical protein